MAKPKEKPKSKAKIYADVSKRAYLNKEDGTLVLALLSNLKADVFIQDARDNQGLFAKKVTITKPLVFIVDEAE
jgi:hypothetical protein